MTRRIRPACTASMISTTVSPFRASSAGLAPMTMMTSESSQAK